MVALFFEVVVCRWLLLVVGRCLLLVVVCRWLLFVVVCLFVFFVVEIEIVVVLSVDAFIN